MMDPAHDAARRRRCAGRRAASEHERAIDMVDASGFYGAPVTKALCGLTLGGFSILSFTGNKKRYETALSQQNILNPVNMLTTPFVFASFGEVICGLMLLYTFRQLERKMTNVTGKCRC